MLTDQKLRVYSFILAVVGLLVSIYLSWVKLTDTEVFCGGSSDCSTVSSSRFADVAGIPVAVLGVGAYLVILILIYMEGQGDFWQENIPLMLFGITLSGTLYSAYLTYIEIFVIRAICPYCVVSAVVMALLLVISIIRLIRLQTEPNYIRRGG